VADWSDSLLDELTGVESYSRIPAIRPGSAIAFVDLLHFRSAREPPVEEEVESSLCVAGPLYVVTSGHHGLIEDKIY
jgi:hypothetical protein